MALLLAAWVGLAPREARATYSIVATDPTSGQHGAAGASCVPYEVIRIARVHGGGAVVAQAEFDDAALEEAAARLAEGEAAPDVLAQVTDAGLHPQAPKMQYGIVDADGAAVAWTGPEAMAFAGHEVAEIDGVGIAVQGNLLTSRRVLDNLRAGFAGCDLAEQLVSALEAAGEGGEGDARCTPEGRPASSAFVVVADANGEVLRLSVPDVSPASPLPALREALGAWRADHPCPAPEPPPVEPPADGGDGGASADGCALAARPLGASASIVALVATMFALLRRRRRARGGPRSPRRPGRGARAAPRRCARRGAAPPRS